VLGPERSQERPGLLEVGGIEAPGEPGIDRREQLIGGGALALAPTAFRLGRIRDLPAQSGLACAGGESCRVNTRMRNSKSVENRREICLSRLCMRC